ncbi:hypothetical protein RB298_05900 [Priestia sp. BR_2]
MHETKSHSLLAGDGFLAVNASNPFPSSELWIQTDSGFCSMASPVFFFPF